MPHSLPPSPQWFSLSITADPVLTEAIEDFLMGIAGAGVELCVEQPGEKVVLNAWFDKNEQNTGEITDILTAISSFLDELADIFHTETPTIQTTFINDEDWSRTWKEHFKPFAIIPDLIITPTWEKYHAQEKERVIVMDPGMAFGTGHHATTCLSLQLLQKVLTDTKDHSVLDVGTGTGILGMAATLFGARRVLAIDNDPAAVSAARENCARNNLTQGMSVAITPLQDVSGTFSVVIANIVHDVLLALAPDLARLTEKGGHLILSGIIRGDQDVNIISCFTKLKFSLKQQENKKEWTALLFQRDMTPER